MAVILIISLIIADYYFNVPAATYFIIAIIWLIITTIGSFNITWNYHVKAYNSNTTIKEKRVAITFDDGPNNKFTPQILELLKTYNAKATFFCTGKQIEQHPNILKNIANDGHTIGNHSYAHSPYFDFYGKQKVITEIEKTNNLIESSVGKKSTLFRPPYGVTNPSISKAVKDTKHHVIGWNIRSLDTVKNSDQKILNRIIRRLSPGAVILLHDSKEITVSVLEQLLLFLQQNGYQSTTIDALFNIEAYA
ncbi:polysaccharide deacetylase family protein [Tamlana sp. 2201CG12-4]|uniref:polysaccharide deacetylase family protein n=1 Tax=Tamlana sp. 2201CG12-4 TaxID=3112582 RepID=UPI002DB89D07|nr:polysaccharide deacetylase family protein [Tamlana sp. 2201CG12-4]MEC3906102.1 polysaccharide deacetylase family protein [Tamlana sp. 2201CG12-4]